MSDNEEFSRMERAEAAMELVMAEIEKATNKYGPFNSPHEGYAVMLEEVDEVWDDVRADRTQAACYEAVQVAAMAIRFIADLGVWESRTKFPISGHYDPEEVPVLASPDAEVDEAMQRLFGLVKTNKG